MTSSRFLSTTFLLILGALQSGLACCEDKTFNVGVILPLSGPLAQMGEASRKGFELFESEHGECAKDVKFLFEDHQYDGKATINAFNKLRSVDKVNFTVVWGNTPSGVASPLAERLHAPTLLLCSNPDAKGKQFVVTFGPKIEMIVDKVTEQFHAWNVKTPAAVSIDIGNALSAVDMIKQKLHGGLIVKVIANNETDFHTIIAGLKSQGVDGLFLLAMPDQALTFAKQANELDFRATMMGGDVFADDTFTKEVLKIQPSISYAYGSVKDEFLNSIKVRYHATSYFFETAMGYTVASLMCSLGQKQQITGKIDPIKEFSTLNLGNSPIQGLRLVKDDSYGLHLENDGKIYTVYK